MLNFLRARSVHGSKEVLVRDLRRIVGDADDLLKEMANSSAEEFSAARVQIEEKLGEARARLDEAQVVATAKLCCATEATCQYIRENPWTLVGVAAAAGLVATVILNRR